MEQPIQLENIEDVKNRIRKSGFDNTVTEQIEKAFTNGIPKAEAKVEEVIENSRMEYNLEVNSANHKGYYNGFRATIHQEGKEPLSQWFKAEDRITKNEAYILLSDRKKPRAIHKTLYDKEGKRYGVWLQIDFSQKTPSGNNYEVKRFHDKYGYDLSNKFNDYEFAGLETAKQKLTAYDKLKQGLDMELTPVNNSVHESVIVRANPERKTFIIMDKQGNYLPHDQFRTSEALARIFEERKNTRVDFTKPSDEISPSDGVKKNSNNHSTQSGKRKKPRTIINDKKTTKSVSR